MNNEPRPDNITGSVVDVALEVAPDLSIRDICEAAAATVVRINDSRSALSIRKLVPKRIIITMEASEPTQDDVELLKLAAATGYQAREPFFSPEEVRMFFTPDVLRATGRDPIYGAAGAKLVADTVIKFRSHCNF